MERLRRGHLNLLCKVLRAKQALIFGISIALVRSRRADGHTGRFRMKNLRAARNLNKSEESSVHYCRFQIQS